MRKVMIVDDEILARKMLRESIVWEEYGYTVISEAQNGKEALEKIKELSPDVVFVDIKMPVMDGLEMLRQMNALQTDSKTVLLTCYEDFSYVRDAMRYGAVDYLTKHTFEPEDLISLLDKIEKQIRKEKAHQESFNILKDDVLNKVMESSLTREDIRKYVEIGILPVSKPRYLMVCFKLQKDLNNEKYRIFENKLKEVLRERIDGRVITDAYTSTVREKEIYSILLCQEECSVSEIKQNIREGITSLHSTMPDKEIRWMTGITYHIFNHWSDLPDALKEVRDIVRVEGEYLECSPKIIMAIEYIRENYHKPITLEEVADYVGISRVYLSQAFKKETNKNIWDYLAQYRLSKAKELLLTSNLKIYAIAELCGFGSPQYFNKIFKRLTGFSPYQFKDNKMQ